MPRYFEENPAELAHLRNDGELGRAARQQPHLKHVPDYLLPKDGNNAINDVGFVPFRKEGGKLRGKKGKRVGGFKASGGRKRDPLKTFRARKKT